MHLQLCPAPKPRTRILVVAFLFPGPDDDKINQMVAKLSFYPCCHVELVFEDQMAFSIFKGSNLFFKQRSFSNPEYQLILLFVSPSEYDAVYSFCQQAHSSEVGFTDAGIVAAYAQPCPIFNTRPSFELGYTFCSKIVTEALQMGNVPEVEHLVPCMTTPSTLFSALKDSRRVVSHTVPYKCQQLMQVGRVFR
jgi:hypothetical protein